jgi:hypothetical protein
MWFSALYGLAIFNLVAFNADVLRDLSEKFSVRAEKHGVIAPIMIRYRLMGHVLLETGEIASAEAYYSRSLALYVPCETPSVCEAFWPRQQRYNLGLPVARFLVAWLS